MSTPFDIDNPYWKEVEQYVDEPQDRWDTRCIWNILRRPVGDATKGPDRHELVTKYSWSVPDPDSIQFVFDHCNGSLFDPIAGTGYWAYLLNQMGIKCLCYDYRAGEKTGHRNAEEHFAVMKGDVIDTVCLHDDYTLFLSWPPYDTDTGYIALKNYIGNRVIYIGEGGGGCTGDDQFHERLDKKWDQVALHVPVQWWGLHDRIYVYDRKA